MALTAKQVENAKGNGITRQEIPDGSNGLYLVVQPESDHKSWHVKYRTKGNKKLRRMVLEGFPSLHDARILAAQARKDAMNGIDPGKAKQLAKEEKALADANTFMAVGYRYLEKECGVTVVKTDDGKQELRYSGKQKSAAQTVDKLRRLVFPKIGHLPVTDIDRDMVTKLLDDIEDANGSVMADVTLASVSRVFHWYELKNSKFRSPLVKGMRKPSSKPRDRILTDDEIRAVWGTNDPFCKFLLLSMARRDEAAEMTWDELDGNIWTLPKARNKIAVDLVRPLSAAAMTILDEQRKRPHCGKYVFGAHPHKPFASFDKHIKRIREESGTTGWTFHDARRTARTLMSRAKLDRDVAERCLGHLVGGKVERTYDRWAYRDEKADAYAALAKLIEAIINPPPAKGVSSLDEERAKRKHKRRA
jgi:integrase